MNSSRYFFVSFLAIVLLTSACTKNSDSAATSADIDEAGQQVGDVMASADESSGNSSGSIASVGLETKAALTDYNRYRASDANETAGVLAPISEDRVGALATCGSTSFGACSAGSRSKVFSACTVGAATFNGTVSVSFAGGNAATDCAVNQAGESATRSPILLVTGRRGATLAIVQTGTIGQRVTFTSGTAGARVFSFSNDGIKRKFTSSSNVTLFDFTTSTTGNITVTGDSRANRVMSGGTLSIANNITGKTCSVSPTAVTWGSTCNCAVSGSWSGTCSDSTTYTLDITGCGTANLTTDGATTAMTFDRCATQ